MHDSVRDDLVDRQLCGVEPLMTILTSECVAEELAGPTSTRRMRRQDAVHRDSPSRHKWSHPAIACIAEDSDDYSECRLSYVMQSSGAACTNAAELGRPT